MSAANTQFHARYNGVDILKTLTPVKKNEWNDISVELYREYIYPEFTLRVDQPTRLHISASSLGGHAHRVETADGLAYYVAPGWKAIRWAVKDGGPLFTF